MSTGDVEKIPVRLKDELERIGMSMAQASRAAGEPSPQRLKDVIGGKQRCPIDLLARLMPLGVDGLYVMTGDRTGDAVNEEGASYSAEWNGPLSSRQRAMLALFDRLNESGQREIELAAARIVELETLRRRVDELEARAGITQQFRGPVGGHVFGRDGVINGSADIGPRKK